MPLQFLNVEHEKEDDEERNEENNYVKKVVNSNEEDSFVIIERMRDQTGSVGSDSVDQLEKTG